MKRFAAFILVCLFIMSMALTGCGKVIKKPISSTITPSISKDAGNKISPEATPTVDPEDKIINIYSFTDEVYKCTNKFKELHPDFSYEFKSFCWAGTDGDYQTGLDQALAAGGADAPDIYCAEATFALKYTKGDMYQYAAPYKELGIDIDNLLKEADIAQYSVEIGTNPNGDIIGLDYKSNGGAFIYRRSIAKDVWNTDDPATIKDKIGPGLDKFFAAADELKAKGYGIVSGEGDIWHAVENSAKVGWLVNGKLHIDPEREKFFDYAKKLKEKGYSNNTQDWQNPWYADMKGKGKKQIFGFFGPVWLINYVMTGYSGGEKVGEGTYGDWAVCVPPAGFSWGGTWILANKDTKKKAAVGNIIKWITLDSSDTGLQYYCANGTLNSDGIKDTVASATVMKKSNGKLDFLDGQNIFDVFIPADKLATGTNKTEFDESINNIWRDQVHEYTSGKKTKERAISDFKQIVKKNLGIDAE